MLPSLGEKCDSFVNCIKTSFVRLENENKELKNEMKELKNENKELKNDIKKLGDILEEREAIFLKRCDSILELVKCSICKRDPKESGDVKVVHPVCLE